MTTLLMLLTWVGWIAAVTGLGALALNWRFPTSSPRTQWLAGLWAGLCAVLVVMAALQLFTGLGGALGLSLSIALWVLGLMSAVLVARRQLAARGRATSLRLSWQRVPVLVILVLVLIGLVLMANLATGEPMDADAGSYRIGAILYAGEFPAIPGLGNLHFRLGFNSTLWPFGALVGTGLWAEQGYRLVTGIFLTALVAALVIRIAVPRPRGSRPGDWFMVIAVGFIGGVILMDVGRWIPSPGQDIAVLVLAVASTALFADFVFDPRRHAWSGALAIIVASAAGSVRPLGWVLAVLTGLLVAVIAWFGRQGSGAAAWRLTRVPLAWVAVTALVMAARDVVLSGWILYPLNALPAPVPWRTSDGAAASRWITEYARVAGGDASITYEGLNWIRPWFDRYLASREHFFLRIMVLGAVVPLLWPRGRAAWRSQAGRIVLAMTPSVVSSVAWFISAPDLRFGWAGLLGAAAIPGAFLLAAGAYPAIAIRVLAPIALALMMATAWINGRFVPRGGEPAEVPSSLGPVSVTLALAPPPPVEAVPGALGDGTAVIFPSSGGNCYALFPLCLIPGTGQDVGRLGERIEDGFALLDAPGSR